MSTESVLKSAVEIMNDETAQECPLAERSRLSMDSVRGMEGLSEYIEHAVVANNFVIMIGGQMVAGQGRVFERVRYRLLENNNQDIVPDVSIMDAVEKRTEIAFISAPCFVMEIVASEWEIAVCRKKLEVYRRAKVPECWVVNWNVKSVEIYCFVDECKEIKAGLRKVVTKENKDELKICIFPDIKFSWEDLFKDVRNDI